MDSSEEGQDPVGNNKETGRCVLVVDTYYTLMEQHLLVFDAFSDRHPRQEQ